MLDLYFYLTSVLFKVNVSISDVSEVETWLQLRRIEEKNGFS